MTLKGINELKLAEVHGNENLFAVVAEFHTRPLAIRIVLPNVKCSEWPL